MPSKPKPYKLCRACRSYVDRLCVDPSLCICDACKAQTKLCDCGCEELIPKYAQYGSIRKFKNRAHAAHHTRTGQKATAETRRKLSIVGKRRFERPGEREAMAARIRGRKHTPETIEKMRNSAKKKFEDPAEHEKASNGQRKRYEDPEAREITRLAMIERYKDPDERKQTSDAIKKWMRENNITLEGPNNPNWRGGIQYEPYDDTFDYEFKESVRARQDYICADYGLGECSVDGKALSVHHIDGDKKNSTMANCIALCNSHHVQSHNVIAQQRHYRIIELYKELAQ